MANKTGSKKLRVLLIPFFATSHIQPITELAIRLAAANEAVEATMAVTPASVSIVEALLQIQDGGQQQNVKIATYPFPTVEGIPKGVENMGTASTPEVSLAINLAAISESLTRPAQETLIRAQSPDAIITDQLFAWNGSVAEGLGVPCVAFSVTGAFPLLAMRHLLQDAAADDGGSSIMEVPRFPAPCIRLPRTELPIFLRRPELLQATELLFSLQASFFGLIFNTSLELEKEYCEAYLREGYVKRAYFIGPVTLLPPSSNKEKEKEEQNKDKCIIMEWLDSKPDRSVVYVSFGSLSQVKDAQLDEIALGLETSGASFLWVVKGREQWSPPKGWEERVKDTGLIVRSWAPQTAILGHLAVGAFLTHCGWNSVLETVAAGVPLLTWPLASDQFFIERLVTEVLGIGERLWPAGAGLRSEVQEEHEVIPGQDVARALTEFMRPGGPGDAARIKVTEIAAKVHAAAAQGGSSHRDLHRLIHDLMAAP